MREMTVVVVVKNNQHVCVCSGWYTTIEIIIIIMNAQDDENIEIEKRKIKFSKSVYCWLRGRSVIQEIQVCFFILWCFSKVQFLSSFEVAKRRFKKVLHIVLSVQLNNH